MFKSKLISDWKIAGYGWNLWVWDKAKQNFYWGNYNKSIE